MPLIVLSVLVQVGLVFHVMKTGRDTKWIWLITFLPLAGSVAYICLELLPDFFGTRTGRKTTQAITKRLNPHKELKVALASLNETDTVESKLRLADELMNYEMYEEAESLIIKCLVGVHKEDSDIMRRLALAEFGLGKFEASITTLNKIKKLHPDYSSAEAHLLYAKNLMKLNRLPEAMHEFEALSNYYPGPEANYFYAVVCEKVGDLESRRKLLEGIVGTAKKHGPHYKDLHNEWITKAKKAI